MSRLFEWPANIQGVASVDDNVGADNTSASGATAPVHGSGGAGGMGFFTVFRGNTDNDVCTAGQAASASFWALLTAASCAPLSPRMSKIELMSRLEDREKRRTTQCTS